MTIRPSIFEDLRVCQRHKINKNMLSKKDLCKIFEDFCPYILLMVSMTELLPSFNKTLNLR